MYITQSPHRLINSRTITYWPNAKTSHLWWSSAIFTFKRSCLIDKISFGADFNVQEKKKRRLNNCESQMWPWLPMPAKHRHNHWRNMPSQSEPDFDSLSQILIQQQDIIRNRATATLRRPQIKQYIASNEEAGGGGAKPTRTSYNFDEAWSGATDGRFGK